VRAYGELNAHLAYLRDRYPNETYRLHAAQLGADLAEASAGDMVGRLRGKPSCPPCACAAWKTCWSRWR
jgi:hypothetical protein